MSGVPCGIPVGEFQRDCVARPAALNVKCFAGWTTEESGFDSRQGSNRFSL
jgi:hypothetical protein